jgi:predicted Zn-dependent peptidase
MQTALGRADQLNMYATYTGDPGYVERDYARYTAVTPQGVRDAVRRYLGPNRIVLSVVPQGQNDLQAMAQRHPANPGHNR